MRIAGIKEIAAINSVLAANCVNPRSKKPQEEGWLADVYRYSSTVHQAQRASQRMLDRLKRHHASKEKSQS